MLRLFWSIVPSVCTTFVCSQNSVVSQHFVRHNVGPSLKALEYEIPYSERLQTNRISGQPYQHSPGQPRLVESVWVLLKTNRILRQTILRFGRQKSKNIATFYGTKLHDVLFLVYER